MAEFTAKFGQNTLSAKLSQKQLTARLSPTQLTVNLSPEKMTADLSHQQFSTQLGSGIPGPPGPPGPTVVSSDPGNIAVLGSDHYIYVPASIAGSVTSVFGRTGAVIAQAGDYSASLVTNAVDRTQPYADPPWITSLSWAKLTGVPALVSSFNGRTGAVMPANGDYTAAMVGAAAANTQIIAGTGLSGGGPISANVTLSAVPMHASGTGHSAGMVGDPGASPGATRFWCENATWMNPPVSSLFGRTGAVIAVSGDYTAAQVTNAVDQTVSYADPAWITSLNYSKLLNVPSSVVWVPYTTLGQAFVVQNMTRDGDWTMVANKNTSDRPAPQASGSQEDLLPAWTPATLNARATYTVYNEWTTNTAGWIDQYGVDVLQQNIAALHTITLSINGAVQKTFSASPNTAGAYWHDITSIMVASGSVIRVSLQVTEVGNNQMYWYEDDGLFATAPTYCSLAVGSKDGATAGTNAYGCHVMFTPGSFSPDWDTVAYGGTATGEGGGSSSGGAVTSVFGRTGVVVAASGDYTAAQVTNAVDQTATYPNPAWITSLAWSKITGAPAAYVLPAATATLLGGVKIGANVSVAADGTISVAAAPVTSVFGRTGVVVAASGDYTAAQVTNAVSTIGSYADPAWITSLSYSKLTGAPTISGSANYVPLFTAANALGNSVIYQSGSNVGIGITNPSMTLVVNGPIACGTNLATLSSGWVGVPDGGKFVSATGTQSYYSPNAGASEIGIQSTLNFRCYNAGAPIANVMYIAANGNIGIGTASPSAGLHVYSTATSGWNSNGNVKVEANQPGFRLRDIASGQEWVQYIGVNPATDGRLGLAYDASRSVHRIVVDTVGNVGINTTTPSNTLEVNGQIAVSSASQGFWLNSARSAGMADLLSGGGSITFRTGGTDQRVVITSAGNVGIGSASPQSLLYLNGPAGMASLSAWTEDFSITTGAANGQVLGFGCMNAAPWGCWIQVSHQGKDGVSFPLVLQPTSGNVIIGTTSSSALFSTGTALAPIKIATYDDGASCYGIGVASGQLTFGAQINAASGTPQMVLTSDSRIGLGTTAPNGALDINVNGAQGWTYHRGNVGGSNPSANVSSGIIMGWNPSNGYGESCIYYGTGAGSRPALYIGRWSGSAANADVILYNGMLGVGVNPPNWTLHVIGPGANQALSASSGQIVIGENSNNAGYHLALQYYNGPGGWSGVVQAISGSAGAPLVLNPLGGGVGIGINNPTGTQLYVNATPGNSITVAAIANGQASTQYALQANCTGAVTNSYGVYINAAGATNNYGLRIAAPAAGTNNYAIYADGTAWNYFAGNVGIGGFPSSGYQLVLSTDNAGKLTTQYWSVTSDARVKRNVRDLEGGLSIINQIRPIEGEWNGLAGTPEGQRLVSVIAQEIQKVLPSTVQSLRKVKLHPDDKEETPILDFNPHEIFYHMILAIKQLCGRLAALEKS